MQALGSTLSIRGILSNRGSGLADTPVRIVLESAGSPSSTARVEIGETTVSLPITGRPFSSIEYDIEVPIDESLLARLGTGTRFLTAVVNPDGAVEEANLDNNRSNVQEITLAIEGQPNLTITGIRLEQSSYPVASTVFAVATVANLGDAPAVTVGNLGPSLRLELYDEDGTRLQLPGTGAQVRLAPLAPGESGEVRVGVKTGFETEDPGFPDLAAGRHDLRARVDPFDTFDESNETDNLSASLSVTLTPNQPNYAITEMPVLLDTVWTIGDRIAMGALVESIGADYAGPVLTRFGLTTQDVTNPDGIKPSRVSSLSPFGADGSEPERLAVRADTSEIFTYEVEVDQAFLRRFGHGEYGFVAEANGDRAVSETTRSDNIQPFATRITVSETAPIDLTGTIGGLASGTVDADLFLLDTPTGRNLDGDIDRDTASYRKSSADLSISTIALFGTPPQTDPPALADDPGTPGTIPIFPGDPLIVPIVPGGPSILPGPSIGLSTTAADGAAFSIDERVIVTDLATGQSDILNSVERISLQDGARVYDLPGDDVPFTYRLYSAAFARTPDEAGLRFWNDRRNDGLGDKPLAEQFVAAPEFAEKFGDNPTDEEFISALFQNVLLRASDPDGEAFWLNAFATGEFDRADMLLFFSYGVENVARNEENYDDGVWVK